MDCKGEIFIMQPRIRKKAKDYCLEFIDEDGEFRAITLNPKKILKLFSDSQKIKRINKRK